MTQKKILVTSALPYANGSIHIGHLVEYIQTDIYVRFRKLRGEDVIYCCADDTHGTPVELNAAKQGMTPEQFIKKYHEEHIRDFAAYGIHFDSYYTTHSPENEHYVTEIFSRLQKKGYIYTKDIELTYCEHDKRFLPDRYVKGTCPNCKSPDQYGDVCEVCNKSYKTTDLINPYCAVCGNRPIRKSSRHYFFKLSAFAKQLEEWLTTNKMLQPEVTNQVLEWVRKGLEDWNISRDAPYFGFKIPGDDTKYFYVWLDAPIGYIASTAHYCKGKDRTAEDYWEKPGSSIIHFIGKDIIYFHFLFWPAVLMGAGLNLPEYIVVHGFLTVNKEKMSKSRGTFLTASDFQKLADPQFLRYYYAANLTRTMTDIDLDLNDFTERINSELVSNIANFVYRVLSFCNKNFESQLLPAQESFLSQFKYGQIMSDYENLEFRNVVKQLLAISSQGNKYFQDNKPWALIKEDRQRAHQVVSNAAHLARDIAILLQPIMPDFSADILQQLNVTDASLSQLGKSLGSHAIAQATIKISKIEPVKLQATDPFAALDLRIAKIVEATPHPEADKLLVLRIDLGTEQRTICAGLKAYYTPGELTGRNIVVVKNLKPARLRGIESKGMLLAAGDPSGPKLLSPSGNPGDRVYAEAITPQPKPEITIEEFAALEIIAGKNGEIRYTGKLLTTDKGSVTVQGVTQDSRVR